MENEELKTKILELKAQGHTSLEVAEILNMTDRLSLVNKLYCGGLYTPSNRPSRLKQNATAV